MSLYLLGPQFPYLHKWNGFYVQINLKEAATPTQGNQSTLLELREEGK